MRTLHIIMPMGGEGSRFKKAGIDTPKPLIKANGVEFYKRAISSVTRVITQFKLTCIVRQDHVDNYDIDKEILSTFPSANIITVEHTTRGAVETCMLAKEYIDDNDTVIVLDCDLEFTSLSFDMFIYNLVKESVNLDGMLVSFESSSDRYSYAEINENNIVLRTAEKNPISTHALVGAYCFASGRTFKRYAQALIDENNLTDNKEFYTSLLYNKMISNNLKIALFNIDTYDSFGTPEELTEYEHKMYNNGL